MKPPANQTRGAILGLLLAVATSVWAINAFAPPEPVPASAPEDEFSAERAFAHVRELGRAPRPLGSPAHSEARDYLLAELRSLGLEPEVQEARMVARQEADRFFAVRVQNVLARLPGRASSGALLLMAHYDSRPNTPGAGDDLAGVAAILESVRALGAGPPLDNDLIILLSDAEELGLVGARAFVERHPWASDVRLVFNFEGRGSRGAVTMFETRSGNLDVARGLRRAVPYPYASSLSYEVYRRMPNDTDFSVFREAGVQGLNLAFLGNHPAYHTMLDTAATLDPATVQHHGSYALGLARHFGRVDLGGLEDASGRDAVYFNPYPFRLIVYPAGWAVPLAAAAALLLLIAIGVGRRRGRLELGGTARGLALFLATLGAGAVVGWCFWWLIRSHLHGLLFGPHGLAYDAGGLLVSLLALIAGVAGAGAGWLGERRRPLELWAGCWLGWAALGLAVAVWVPGASYLTSWPLLAAAAGTLVLGLPRDAGGLGRSEPLIMALAALPAVVLLAPMVATVAEALTLRAAAVIGTAAGLLLTALLPLLARLHQASRGKSSLAAVAAGLGLVAWIAVVAEPSAESPAVDTLAYAVDTESGEAWWASFDERPDPWTALVLGAAPERTSAPGAFSLPDTEVLLAPAEPLTVLSPTAETRSDSRARGRRIEAVASSSRGAAVLRIRAEASVPYLAVSVEGERFDFDADPEARGLGEVSILAFGFGSDDVRIGFEMAEAWPVELELVDVSWGFHALPEPPAPRPPGLIPSSSWRTDAVCVRSSRLL